MFKEYEKLDRERKRKNRANSRLQKDEVQMGLDEIFSPEAVIELFSTDRMVSLDPHFSILKAIVGKA